MKKFREPDNWMKNLHEQKKSEGRLVENEYFQSDFEANLRKLSEKQARVIKLIIKEEKSIREVAEELSIGEHAARTLLKEGLAQMGKYWLCVNFGVFTWEITREH